MARRFGGRAVALAPSRRFRAYYFASAASLLADADRADGFGYSEEDVRRLSSWLPDEGALCEQCSEPAHFRWDALEILGNDPYDGFVEYDGCFEAEVLCGGCLAERLQTHLREKGISLGMVEMPEDPDGIVWIPQEW